MEIQNDSQDVNIHLNIPQLIFTIANCRHNILLWGRRTGKTEGPIVDFSLRNILDMPRSNGFAVGTTYEQLLTRTLPPLFAGWAKMGFHENVHYWVRKYAPDHLDIDKAYRHPVKADHYIHWFNGSGIYLVSQDRPGTINGVATQWGFGDEAKFLNREKLQEEVLLTLSGNADKFGDKYNYLSTLFCSDMPTNAKGRWLIDAKADMDPKIIELIIGISQLLQDAEEELLAADKKSDSTFEKARAKVNGLNTYLNELKKLTTYYSTATTFDNIHALGMDVIKNFLRQLDAITFLTSVLNELVEMVENCFYSGLNSDHHGEDSVNYDFVDDVVTDFDRIPERDCRWDNDRVDHLPLYLSCDYNNAINCAVTGQVLDFKHERRFISSLYVENPLMLGDLVDKWCAYYEKHPCKDVYYVYDQTAVSGAADRNISFADQWIKGLQDKGWNVIPTYIGAASWHRPRYWLWNEVLREKDSKFPIFRYNKEACKVWQVSCERAGVIQGANEKREFKKDKRSERDKKIPPYEATHMSEAGDCLFWYWYYGFAKEESSFVDMLIG